MKGFTLIELLLTITILGILSALALPSMKYLLAQNQIAGDTNQLVRAIQLARLTAINHQENTLLCPSNDGINCEKSWKNGYLVITNDEPLAYFSGPKNKGNLTYPHSTLKFAINGFVTGDNGTFVYENFLGESKREIIISNTGRVRLSAP